MNMAKNFSNVMDYKVVANNGFTFNVNVYGVNNFGNKKWMLKAVDVIRDYFTFDDDDVDNGLIINVVVNTHEIIVKAEFNGKKYWAYPIQPRYGKNQIKGILDNMGVVKDVIDVYTNSMVNNNMEENNMNDMVNSVDMELAIERLADDIADRADKTMGDYFVDVTRYMWNANDDIDEDRLRELLFDKVDGVADIEFAESDDAIVRIWFNRPIKKDVLVGEEQENALESAMNDIDMLYINCYDEIGVDDMVKNNPPCLDEDEYDDNEWSDRDWLIKNTADTIKDYVDNYEGMLMDYNGYSASICVPWDIFNEDDMKMLIEDDDFEYSVVVALMQKDINDVLVYDDGVYVSVNADMFDNVA